MNYKYYSNNNNNNATNPKFCNFKNLFYLRSLVVISVTLTLSFTFRSFIVYYFTLDLSLFSDFFCTGFIVSFLLSCQSFLLTFQYFLFICLIFYLDILSCFPTNCIYNPIYLDPSDKGKGIDTSTQNSHKPVVIANRSTRVSNKNLLRPDVYDPNRNSNNSPINSSRSSLKSTESIPIGIEGSRPKTVIYSYFVTKDNIIYSNNLVKPSNISLGVGPSNSVRPSRLTYAYTSNKSLSIKDWENFSPLTCGSESNRP